MQFIASPFPSQSQKHLSNMSKVVENKTLHPNNKTTLACTHTHTLSTIRALS